MRWDKISKDFGMQELAPASTDSKLSDSKNEAL